MTMTLEELEADVAYEIGEAHPVTGYPADWQDAFRAAIDERDELRETVMRLNRRLQVAESRLRRHWLPEDHNESYVWLETQHTEYP